MPIIGKDEYIIIKRKATYEGGGGIKIPGRKTGELILTNKRIIFEYIQGLFSKKTFTPLDTPISEIVGVSGEGMFSKKLVIELRRRDGRTGRVKFTTSNVDEWIKEITILVTEMRETES